MAWFDTDWIARIEITIPSSKVATDLTDFPVYLDLSTITDNTFWAQVNSSGNDIRITKSDGTTQVPVEIVVINTSTKTGEVHFMADGTLSSSSDNTFYIYFGNSGASMPAADSTYGSEAVWADYLAVWHMQEDPSGSAPQILDSTAGGYDGTSAGSMTTGDSVAGALSGNAVDFEGTDDTITVTDNAAFDAVNTESSVISFWMKTSSNASATALSHQSTDVNGGWGVYSQPGSPDRFRAYWRRSGSGASAAVIVNVDSGSTYYDGNWHKVTASKDENPPSGSLTGRAWLDGSFQDSSNTLNTDTPAFPSSDISMGADQGGTTSFYNVVLDEIRIKTNATYSNLQIDTNAELTEYNNQNDPATFTTFGAAEFEFDPRQVVFIG